MRTLPLTLCLLPFLGACVFHIESCSDRDCIQGSGARKTEARAIAGFTNLEVESCADVVVRIGEPASLQVTTDDNLLQYVVTEVRDGTLVVTTRSGSYSFRSGLVVEVTTPSLLGVDISGSSDVTVEGLVGSSFSAAISGSGSIHASGSTDELAALVEGSGDLELFGLIAKTADVRITGSGGVQVHATEQLSASISGSGDIRYRGDPRLKGISIAGSGSIQAAKL